MATEFGLFDSVAGDRTVDAADFANVFAGIVVDGFVIGNGGECQVTQTSPVTANVEVSTGFVFIQGRWLRVFSAAETVTVAAANATNPRIDRVVVRVDYSARTVALVYLQGTAAPSPTAPALTQTAGVTWENPLAQIFLPANATQIYTLQADAGGTQGYVTDERTRIYPSGGGMLHLGTAVGDGVASSLAVEWENDPRIQALWFSGRLDSDDTGNFEQAELYVNDDTGPNYSVFRHDTTRSAAYSSWEGADDNSSGFLMRVGGNGGGLNGHVVNAQNPADCLVDFSAVSRWGTAASAMRLDRHMGLYKPGGPITKLSIENLAVGFSSASNFRVWGFLESL